MAYHISMFTDNNRPEGLYGEVYDRQTGVINRSNIIDRPVVGLWKGREIDELLIKISKDLK